MKKSSDLNFHFGTMGSGKTAQLLMKYYNCKKDNGMNVLLLTSQVDNRAGIGNVESRTGIQSEAITVDKNTNILDLILSKSNIDGIFVDEIQFFTSKQIKELKELADNNISVDVYGLKNNFKGELFGEKSKSIKTILELATNIIEIKSFCACGNNATHVARFNRNDWVIQRTGPEILIGGNDNYAPLCYRCWSQETIPRVTRIRILNNVFEEETKKGINTDVNKLYKLREEITLEEKKHLEDEVLMLRDSTRKTEAKIKMLMRTKSEK